MSLFGRLCRFAITGGLAGTVQLSLLAFLTRRGWGGLDANAVAFLVAAQVNFAMSSIFTWRDRRVSRELWQQWVLFHCSIAGMTALNMLVFAIARNWIPDLAASASGIVVAAAGNFLTGDRFVFKSPAQERGSAMRSEEPAA